MGSAPCLKLDLRHVPPGDVMAVNDAGWKYAGNIKFWCSYHPDNFLGFKRWLDKRREIGGNMDFQIVSDTQRDGIVDRIIPGPAVSGSSSLLGVLAGMAMGYAEIILAGVPLDDKKYRVFRLGWPHYADQLRGRVRSLSGWTRDYLEALNAA